jgi:hypothetical protein
MAQLRSNGEGIMLMSIAVTAVKIAAPRRWIDFDNG